MPLSTKKYLIWAKKYLHRDSGIAKYPSGQSGAKKYPSEAVRHEREISNAGG